MSLIALLRKKTKKIFFTTPSHSGDLYLYHKFYQWYKKDISEVDEFDPQKALEQAESKASHIYKTKSTHFLTNGSSSGVIASVLACCKHDDKVLIWNNAHPCHKNAVKLAGAMIIDYELPYNSEWDIFEAITVQRVEQLIHIHKPKAIIITSPSYEGLVSDIPNISKICRKSNVYLIADEAHGALYPFSDKLPESAIKYADFTIQSLHKTAGGINPTALLHCNCDCNIKDALNKITTTSPSYPMLATIEANINYLNSSKGRKALENLILQLNDIYQINDKISFYGDDITKILIKIDGITGEELSNILSNEFNIEDEKANNKSVLLLTGLGTTKSKLNKLNRVLKKLNKI